MRKEKIYTQGEPSTTWNIPLPDGIDPASVAVEVIRDTNSNRLFPDNDRVENDMLVLHFGLDEHAGTVRYSWVDSSDDPQVVQDGAGNNVTITVTQNAGGTPTGTTF